MIVILSVHPRIFYHSSPVIYLITMVLGLAVAFLGREVNGARAWFEVGSFRLQPAEFMKLSTALMVAYFFANRPVRLDRFSSQLLAGLWLLIPVVLLLLQKDTGSALVYVAFVLVFYREGLSVNYLLFGLASAFVSVLTLWLGANTMAIVLPATALLYVVMAANSRKAALVSIRYLIPAPPPKATHPRLVGQSGRSARSRLQCASILDRYWFRGVVGQRFFAGNPNEI
jgi:rod shape determining protein RodA